MRQLAKSMMSLSWAASLYGVRQLSRGLDVSVPGGCRGCGRNRRQSLGHSLSNSLDAVTWTTQKHLGQLLQSAYQLGDEFQNEWLDAVADALGRREVSPLATHLLESSVETLRFGSPLAEGASARQELRNKLKVYRLVRGVEKILAIPPGTEPFALEPIVERALEHDPYSAMWLVEGAGHDYVARFLARPAPLRGVLAEVEVPEKTWIMLHAGLGLALAEHLLAELSPASSRSQVRGAVERFIELCHANSRAGHTDAALESLGLVARCFFPEMVPTVGHEVDAMSDDVLSDYYWHGVGRGVYFVPVNFIPGYGSVRHVIDMARRLAPSPRARASSLAGAGYAVALVNLSHPGVLENTLRRHSDALRGPFVEGLVSSILMRRNITPDDPGLKIFLNHRPADPHLAELWREVILRPYADALSGQSITASATGGCEVYRSLVSPEGFGLVGKSHNTPAQSSGGGR